MIYFIVIKCKELHVAGGYRISTDLRDSNKQEHVTPFPQTSPIFWNKA